MYYMYMSITCKHTHTCTKRGFSKPLLTINWGIFYPLTGISLLTHYMYLGDQKMKHYFSHTCTCKTIKQTEIKKWQHACHLKMQKKNKTRGMKHHQLRPTVHLCIWSMTSNMLASVTQIYTTHCTCRYTHVQYDYTIYILITF